MMKTQPLKYKLLLGILLLFLQISINAQNYAERTLYGDSFSSQNVDILEVINKYGSIHIKVWDKDSIKITTDVYLSASSLDRLDRLKSGVRVKYNKYNNTIMAQTIFGDKRATFIKELQFMARDLTPSGEKHMEINYEVYLPKGVAIKINNKYGDVFIDDFESGLTLDQSNGSFNAHNLSGEVALTFSFVNAMINELKDGFLKLNYSTVNLNKSVNLRIESKSSELHTDEIGVMKLSSSRDKINIKQLDYVFGSANYTNIKIVNLHKEIDGYFNYGRINVDNVSSTAESIDIDSERTDIKLYISKKSSYKYDILYHQDVDLILPHKEIKPTDNMEVEEMKSIKGKTGENPNLDIRIRALKRSLVQIQRIND